MHVAGSTLRGLTGSHPFFQILPHKSWGKFNKKRCTLQILVNFLKETTNLDFFKTVTTNQYVAKLFVMYK